MFASVSSLVLYFPDATEFMPWGFPDLACVFLWVLDYPSSPLAMNPLPGAWHHLGFDPGHCFLPGFLLFQPYSSDQIELNIKTCWNQAQSLPCFWIWYPGCGLLLGGTPGIQVTTQSAISSPPWFDCNVMEAVPRGLCLPFCFGVGGMGGINYT